MLFINAENTDFLHCNTGWHPSIIHERKPLQTSSLLPLDETPNAHNKETNAEHGPVRFVQGPHL